MDGEAGRREGQEEEPSMHDQTSVSHWSAPLAFSDLLLWPKRKEEEEEEGGGYNREFRDIGRWNDCRSCLLLSVEAERRGYVHSITNMGDAGAEWHQQGRSSLICKQQVR